MRTLLKTHFKFIVLCALFLAMIGANVSFAQDIDVNLEISSDKVALGSSIKLIISIVGTQNANPIKLPDIEGFDVQYLGPSRRVSIVNGQYSSSIAFSYSLFPLKVGSFEIPAFDVTVSGQDFTTEPVQIQVVDSSAGQNNQSQSPAVSLKDKIFVQLKIPKTEVFVNEPLPINVQLYVSGLAIRDIQYPKIDNVGLKVEDFDQPKQYEQVINGIRYNVVEFDALAYPTRAGEVEIDPVKIDCNVLLQNQRRSSRGSMFDSFFNDDFFNGFLDRYEKRPITIESEQVVINVKELPKENKPDRFTGAVGKYNFEATATPKEVKEGDPITLKMKIWGEGNLDAVKFPKVKESDQLKVYEPNIKEEYGTKILEQVIIPKTSQVQKIPKIEFSYFDVEAKAYRTITQGPFPIQVAELKETDKLKVVGSPGEKDYMQPETIGEDIVFIKSNWGNLRRKDHVFYREGVFYAAILMFLLICGITFGLYKRKERLETDVVFARKMQAPRFAKKGLAKANELMQSNKKKEFYDIIFKTLQHYLGNKFHLKSNTLTFNVVKNKINVSHQQIVNDIKSIFDECDMIRYAAAQITPEKMQMTYHRLEKIIDYCERHMK